MLRPPPPPWPAEPMNWESIRGSLRARSAPVAVAALRTQRGSVAPSCAPSNYETRITLDDIAAAASLSKFHLVRLFRQVHGTTPHQYLVQKRLAAANRMLARPELELGEIAALTGFGSRWTLFQHLRRNTSAGARSLSSAHARFT